MKILVKVNYKDSRHPTTFWILHKNEKIGLVYADFTIVDMEGRIIEEIKEAEPSELK